MISSSARSLFIRRGVKGYSFSPNQWISSTSHLLDQVTVNVPSMGDSITEGTIVEWLKVDGDPVKVDDVVALVETDKVTVEIKADVDGVIQERFAAVDENVEVGTVLYTVDTDADISQNAATSSQDSESKPGELKLSKASEEGVVSTEISTQSRVRIPSMKFLGRAGWLARRSTMNYDETTNNAGQVYNFEPLEAPAIDPMFGRPLLSEDEMNAIELGGANMSPTIKKYSSGAVFA